MNNPRKPKVVAIIQARTGSTRFPNKVFALLSGKPLIWHCVDRLKKSKEIDEIVLATTTNPRDIVLEEWAKENNVSCYRGSENNVLNRFYEAAKQYHADVIVRITSDDPFKDYEVIDHVIDVLRTQNLDFAYNNNPPSFPEGLDTEVFTFTALESADNNSASEYEQEHVTQHFYRKAESFKQKNVSYTENLSNLRWTIDTEADFEMAQQVYNALYKEGETFLFKDILTLLEKRPEITEINDKVAKSAMYR
jgi:spore coat polysaccharide biosynthesis protein SpsF